MRASLRFILYILLYICLYIYQIRSTHLLCLFAVLCLLMFQSNTLRKIKRSVTQVYQ
jgi:hypothetical protein